MAVLAFSSRGSPPKNLRLVPSETRKSSTHGIVIKLGDMWRMTSATLAKRGVHTKFCVRLLLSVEDEKIKYKNHYKLSSYTIKSPKE
jgi:hypothetical protein